MYNSLTMNIHCTFPDLLFLMLIKHPFIILFNTHIYSDRPSLNN